MINQGVYGFLGMNHRGCQIHSKQKNKYFIYLYIFLIHLNIGNISMKVLNL